MSAIKHTPGPWNVELPLEDICFSIVDDADEVYDWKMVANASWDDEEDRTPGHPFVTKEEAEANAYLIAAAPQLFDACNAILGLLQLVCGRDDIPAHIRELLLHNHRVRGPAVNRALSPRSTSRPISCSSATGWAAPAKQLPPMIG